MKWFTRREPAVALPSEPIVDYTLPDRVQSLYYQCRFGLGPMTQEGGPPADAASLSGQPVLGSARKAFRETLDAGTLVDYMPRLPAVLPRLIALLRDPDAGSADLVDLLVKDPTLVARVLSLANSPYFRRSRQPLEDLGTAVVYLGEEGLQAVVNATVMQPILTVPDGGELRGFSAEIYGQALATAELARLLADQHGFQPAVQHLCGLLHATGEVSILAFAVRWSSECVESLPDIGADLCSAYARAATFTAASQWELGAEIERHLICRDDGAPGTAEADFARRALTAAQLRWLFATDSLEQEVCESHLETLGLCADVLTMMV